METNSGDYWIDYYLRELDSQYREITGEFIVQSEPRRGLQAPEIIPATAPRQLGLWESDRYE